RYAVATLALADDVSDAEAITGVLSFADARREALKHSPPGEGARTRPGGITVDDAIRDHVEWLLTHRSARAAPDAKKCAELYILPKPGSLRVGELTTAQLNKWRDKLASEPGYVRAKKDKPKKQRPPRKTADTLRARKATLNRVITVLKSALNHAYREGRVEN